MCRVALSVWTSLEDFRETCMSCPGAGAQTPSLPGVAWQSSWAWVKNITPRRAEPDASPSLIISLRLFRVDCFPVGILTSPQLVLVCAVRVTDASCQGSPVSDSPCCLRGITGLCQLLPFLFPHCPSSRSLKQPVVRDSQGTDERLLSCTQM